MLQFLQRTVRTSAVIIEIQPNFKVKGQRFSSLELKRLFNELVESSLSVWLDANTIEISPNQTDRTDRIRQNPCTAGDRADREADRQGTDLFQQTDSFGESKAGMKKEQGSNPRASETRFSPLKLTSQECLNLIVKLRMDFNQTQIIERVWEVKKDGSAAWNEAYAEYKDVIETLE